MEQYSMSVPHQQQQQIPIESQRPYSTSPQRNVNDPPFTSVIDAEPQKERSYGTMDENEKKLDFIPGPVAAILGSTYCFIILCVSLIFPILHVAFGGAYLGQCTISPNIPIYLIVTGSCGMASIVLTLAVVGAFICCIKRHSIAGTLVTGCCFGVVFFIIFLMSLFLFAWFIAGNVWVFGVNNNVDYDNPFSPNYCNRTLYQFAFAMLIITYVMSVVSCCGSCVRACCQAGTTLKS